MHITCYNIITETSPNKRSPPSLPQGQPGVGIKLINSDNFYIKSVLLWVSELMASTQTTLSGQLKRLHWYVFTQNNVKE